MDHPDLSGPGLGIIHVNAQSLLPKMGELELLLYNVRPDIACITETWLSDNTPDGILNRMDYTIYRLDRLHQKRGGGIACYFHNSLL